VIKTLAQLELLTGYSVKPKGIISEFENGGIVIPGDALSIQNQSWNYGKDFKMIVSISDIGRYNWEISKELCNSIMLNGYTDWVLPSKEDLLLIHRQYKSLPFVNFDNGAHFWSYHLHSSPNFNEYAWSCSLNRGLEENENERNCVLKTNDLNARPIRIIKGADYDNVRKSVVNFEFGDYDQWTRVILERISNR
jgi:hypothetical protein